jgi:hypothetical protein
MRRVYSPLHKGLAQYLGCDPDDVRTVDFREAANVAVVRGMNGSVPPRSVTVLQRGAGEITRIGSLEDAVACLRADDIREGETLARFARFAAPQDTVLITESRARDAIIDPADWPLVADVWQPPHWTASPPPEGSFFLTRKGRLCRCDVRVAGNRLAASVSVVLPAVRFADMGWD